MGRGRDAGVDQDLLHPGLGPFQPGAVGARPEHQPAAGPQPVGQAVDQRRLGPDHVQVGVDLRGRGRGAELDAAGQTGRHARVAGRDHHRRRCGTGPRPGRARGPPAPTTQTSHQAGAVQCPKDELFPAGADADQPDRHAGLVGQECDVVLGLARQLVQLGGVRQVGLPAGQLLVTGVTSCSTDWW